MKRAVVAWLVAVSTIAAADPPPSAQKEAGKHFQRGVALYNEADYRAALVEFRRAYEIAPNAVVLYNIGETHYQLQNYAAALTLERYVNEAGDKASHRDEVDQTLEILRTRVGKVAVTANVAGCEITVDDELVGKSPLASPVLVSIGRRKITAMYPGRAPDTRFVEVATGDTVKLALSLADPDAAQPAQPLRDSPNPPAKSSLTTIGWVTTGMLGAGAIAMGILAYHTSSQLKDEKATFPASGDDLNKKASRVTTYSAIADILGGAALVTGGLTLALTISRSKTHEVRVGVNPGGVVLGGTFK